MVETRGCLHPHIFDLLRRKARGPSASIGLDTKRSYAFACHYRPCWDQEEICFGVRLAATPQGLRKARAWQRVAARPTRLDLKEAFEYASCSFLNAIALCCDLRCKIKQN